MRQVPGESNKTESGFTLIEVVITCAVTIAIAALAIPRFNSLMALQRARTAAQTVARELQSARLKAVTSSRRMRVKLNCPVAGQLRAIEVTGVSATDNAANRCDESAFPFPGPNDMVRSTPELDSPLTRLPLSTTVASTVLTFEFGPRGDVSSVSTGGVVTPLTAEVTVTVTRAGFSSAIRVNEIGRIKVG